MLFEWWVLMESFLKNSPPPSPPHFFGIMSKTNQQATINTMFIEYSSHQSFLVTASSMPFKLTKWSKNKWHGSLAHVWISKDACSYWKCAKTNTIFFNKHNWLNKMNVYLIYINLCTLNDKQNIGSLHNK